MVKVEKRNKERRQSRVYHDLRSGIVRAKGRNLRIRMRWLGAYDLKHKSLKRRWASECGYSSVVEYSKSLHGEHYRRYGKYDD